MKFKLKSKNKHVSRTKKKVNKNKLKTKTKILLNGGSNGGSNKGSNKSSNKGSNDTKENLLIFYEDNININGKDMTGKDDIYKNEPNVVINNAKSNKIYMITMTDPDAPNGEENPVNKNNSVYTHWVYISMQINTKDEKNIVFVNYATPSPPRGTHRYQFRLYDITNKIDKNNSLPVKISGSDLKSLILSKEEISKNEYRQNYIKILFNFFKNLNPIDEKEIQPLDSLQYKVTSKNVKMTNNQIKNIQNKIMAQKMKIKQNKEISHSIQSTQQSTESQKLQTPETKQLQNQIARQQEQINQLQAKDKKRWGFGKTVVAYTAADIALSGLVNLF